MLVLMAGYVSVSFFRVSAADVFHLAVTDINIQTAECTASLTSSPDGSGGVKLRGCSVTILGKKYTVPADALEGLADVNLGETKIVSTSRIVANGRIAVFFDFGPRVAIDKEGKNMVRSRAFFVFDKDGYLYRNVLIPVKHSGKWRYFIKDAVSETEDDPIIEPRMRPDSPPSEPVIN